jgi:ribosomal protein RSM22 (predicted rRNA methylase)
MSLPHFLQEQINSLAASLSHDQLLKARTSVTERYRSANSSFDIRSFQEAVAYGVARFPATYQVVRPILRELPDDLTPQTLLDLGSGPGTAFWATLETFPTLGKATLVERNPFLKNLSQHLQQNATAPSIAYLERDLNNLSSFNIPQHDLVILSYVLSEIDPSEQDALVSNAWNLMQKALVLIEPGTPKGFDTIRRMRDLLIQRGALMLGPCGHNAACPMVGSDWCHFSQRIERSSVHQASKAGTLSWEDEKYSYLIAISSPIPSTGQRILKAPLKHTGHLQLDLCTPHGIKRKTMSKRQKEGYKKARKLEWGDLLPNDPHSFMKD